MNAIIRITALSGLLLGGCEVVPLPGKGVPPPTVYVLNTPAAAAMAEGPSLGVAPPRTAAGLDSPRMLARTGANALTPIARAAWAAPLSPLFSEYLIAQMEASGRFRLVGSSTAAVNYDRGLSVDIQIFEIDATMDGRQAKVRLRARLSDRRARTVIAARSFSGAAPVRGGRAADVAAAFQAAIDAATAPMADWAAGAANS